MKRRWKNKRKAEGKSTENPNIVMNSAVQVCWEKVTTPFCFNSHYCGRITELFAYH
jgi:glutamate decarboxylase